MWLVRTYLQDLYLGQYINRTSNLIVHDSWMRGAIEIKTWMPNWSLHHLAAAYVYYICTITIQIGLILIQHPCRTCRMQGVTATCRSADPPQLLSDGWVGLWYSYMCGLWVGRKIASIRVWGDVHSFLCMIKISHYLESVCCGWSSRPEDRQIICALCKLQTSQTWHSLREIPRDGPTGLPARFRLLVIAWRLTG